MKKVVVPAAGLGTRLLPATKELPKEMLPIFSRTSDGVLFLKPIMQQIFENLYNVGFTEFCFVVGRGKRAIEDHFTQDYDYLEILKKKNNFSINIIEEFYKKIKGSNLVFINQPSPRGFGDAVLKTQFFAGSEPFLVHAGDDLIVSDDNLYLSELVRVFYEKSADCVFLVEEIDDPKKYGVIEGNKIDKHLYQVNKIIEKPEHPPSNLAVIAIYAFTPIIFDALNYTNVGRNAELQLTDAIQYLINENRKVYALQLHDDLQRIDVGTPVSYWNSLSKTYYYKK